MRVSDLVPGGILESDHMHERRNDNTCSRCRRAIPKDEVPLMLFSERSGLLIYCAGCTKPARQ